jgi:hypothetical protein
MPPTGIQRNLDNTRLGQQAAERAELLSYRFGEPARCSSRSENLSGSSPQPS